MIVESKLDVNDEGTIRGDVFLAQEMLTTTLAERMHKAQVHVNTQALGWDAGIHLYKIEELEQMVGSLTNLLGEWREAIERAGGEK